MTEQNELSESTHSYNNIKNLLDIRLNYKPLLEFKGEERDVISTRLEQKSRIFSLPGLYILNQIKTILWGFRGFYYYTFSNINDFYANVNIAENHFSINTIIAIHNAGNEIFTLDTSDMEIGVFTIQSFIYYLDKRIEEFWEEVIKKDYNNNLYECCLITIKITEINDISEDEDEDDVLGPYYFGNINDEEENYEAPNFKHFKPINGKQTFYSDECIICNKNKPDILFCDCGHICICDNCDEMGEEMDKCPICRKVSTIKRKI